MRTLCGWLIAVSVVSGMFVAATARLNAEERQLFRTREQVLNWISVYREDAEPHKLPAFVKAVARLRLLEDDQRSGIYFGFVAGILADNQTKAAEFAADMFPLRPENQIIVIRSLAYSGLPQWKKILSGLTERMPARKKLITTYLFGKGKTLEQISFKEGPQVLDAWWGFYFATGSYHPALKIVSALKWAGEENNLELLTVGSMAKWTLATNASRDKYLLDFLREEQAHQKGAVKTHLREVVLAAENYEVGKLRRKTLATIEKLKKNGPVTWKKWAWWGKAGQLAMTAGCVAASALGQVQFGLPCVLGGAASTGLLQLLNLQQTKPE